ncbi:MAG: FAD-dependent oxidoreductase [Treponema sp.]|nr:FAD-dependent oxidoreductase [Treponema sp.]
MKKMWLRSGVFALVLAALLVFAGCDNGTTTTHMVGINLTHETDIVVVGAGGAGFSAALEAVQLGKRVIIVEQLSFTGGNTLVNGGGINAAIVDANFRTERPRLQATGQTMTETEIEYVLKMINMSAFDEEYMWLDLTSAQRTEIDAVMAPWQAELQRQWNIFTGAGGLAPGGGWFDSPELHMLQTFESGDFINFPHLLEPFARGARGAYEWLLSLGATVTHQGQSPGPNLIVGSLWHRNYMLGFNAPGTGGPGQPGGQQIPNPDGLTGGAGVGFIRPQEAEFLRLGGTRLLNHRATEIIVDEDGRVTGVLGVTRNGTFRINANAVIMATGGFGGNPAMLAQFNPNRVVQYMPGLHSGNPRTVLQWVGIENYGTTNMISAVTGEGIMMAQRAGANLVHMGEIQLLPGGGVNSVNNVAVCELGLRLVNESGRRDVLSLQWAAANYRGGRTFNVNGSTLTPAGDPTAVRIHATNAALVARMLANFHHDVPPAAATLTAAQQAHVAQFVAGNALFDQFYANFNEVIRNYNASNSLDYYGVPIPGWTSTEPDEAGKLVKGPSLRAPWQFGINGMPNVHHTMGGIDINARAEALRPNGTVIPGLYAAGEVIGGLHGSNRVGGNAVTDIIVFGRLAAQSAVENMTP